MNLEKLLKELELDTVLLSETWLKPNQNFLKPGFSVFREHRINGYGRIAILVRNFLPHKKIQFNLSNINFAVIGVEVRLPNGKEIDRYYFLVC